MGRPSSDRLAAGRKGIRFETPKQQKFKKEIRVSQPQQKLIKLNVL